MSASTVHVKNISSSTSEKEVKDFFSFCGKISSIEITPSGETQSATVAFEKETAAKTALLLDNTALGATQVKVTSASGSAEDDGSHYTTNAERDSDEITQEEKPRSRIVAEYLAHGYVIGDQAVQRAIDLDQKHGVTNRFLSTLQNLDSKYHATDKAKSIDQSYKVSQNVSNTTNSLLSGLTSYYEKAAGTPTGKKLVNFYSQTSRQVQDIHAEARRLADLKKQDQGVQNVPGTEKTKLAGGKMTCTICKGNSKDCLCESGKCACNGCAKATVTELPGGKTKCTACKGNSNNCPCEAGKCACDGCAKATVTKVSGGKMKCTTCKGDFKNCPCEAGKCACDGCAKATMTEVSGGKTKCTNCHGEAKDCPCEAGKCACEGFTPFAAPPSYETASASTSVVDSTPLEPEKGTYA
ncbi:hypothetical protein G7Y89_g3184 [Cudoniella acicularis]|uniref:RRM domain-containing protein n=1 Tax=Cudoniella acicularis TaxID=354080 RepID=A0A8H4W5E6_9HELO|nr:hypothetical protein G7Y89_g3184 [Cudoniella acicularis]